MSQRKYIAPKAINSALVERDITHLVLMLVQEHQLRDHAERFDLETQVEGNGIFRLDENCLAGRFEGGPGSYQLRVKLPQTVAPANGLSVRYRIRGWDNIRYLAIGNTAQKAFHHVKISNPKQDEWVTFSIGFGDIAYKLQNGWGDIAAGAMEDVRLYISGTPNAEGSEIQCAWVSAWHEDATFFHAGALPRNPELFDALQEYFSSCNPNVDEQVERFLNSGSCPMTGESYLPWPVDEPRPPDLPATGTYRYLWHAMQPAISMMVYAHRHTSEAAIYAARDYINGWLDSSFFHVDPDPKYAWYDHGTAERLMALLLMHENGLQRRFDYRFMSKLRLALYKHAQLLESEVFYAFHQPTRYHNHAWFQDMALIAAAVAMPDLPCARRWLDRSIERLEDQLSALIVRDGGFAIFVENSIGYHHGIQRLVEFAGTLTVIAQRETDIPAIASELDAWSQFLRYPDGRAPSQGDTFRRPNPVSDDVNFRRGAPYSNPTATTLSKAGYAVVKGNHQENPFMLCMFASSLGRTHKHEDNLSITLWFDGIEWLADPSFYSHEYGDSLPRFLRSARAHNNLCIPLLPYSIEPGRAKLHGDCTAQAFRIEGSHSAYDDVQVSREVRGTLGELRLQVQDSLVAADGLADQARLVFCCGEGVRCRISDRKIYLSHSATRYQLKIQLPDHAQAQLHRGWSEDTCFAGVIGHGFGEKVDTDALEVRWDGCELCWELEVLDLE